MAFSVSCLYLPQKWSILSAGLGLILLGAPSTPSTAWHAVGAQYLVNAETSVISCSLPEHLH